MLLLSVLAGVAEPQRAVAPLPPPPPGLPPPPPSPRELEIAAEVLSAFPQVSQQELMSFARVHLPDELERFAVAARRDSAEAPALFGEVVRRTLELTAIRERDPERFARLVEQQQLNRRTDRMAQWCRALKDGEREKMVTELTRTLESAFDVKQVLMQREVADMESQLVTLTELLERRHKHRKAIISRRLNELLDADEALEW